MSSVPSAVFTRSDEGYFLRTMDFANERSILAEQFFTSSDPSSKLTRGALPTRLNDEGFG